MKLFVQSWKDGIKRKTLKILIINLIFRWKKMQTNFQQAYDRAITVFSPDGRLFQVEYAKEAVKKGATSLGVIGKDCVVLAALKNISSSLVIPESIKKTFEIDKQVYSVASGLIGDARKLIDYGRYYVERHKLIYSERPTVTSIARYIADTVQFFTQYGGGRPFGVSLLIAGIDDVPYLYEVEPSGSMIGYYAISIGENKKEVDDALEKKYKKDMEFDEVLHFVADVLKNTVKKVNMPVEIVYYKKGMEKFEYLSESEIKKLFSD